ncbi:MAG: cytochrome c5 [Saprospiraceae bacterium]|jgi:cytochrome c5
MAFQKTLTAVFIAGVLFGSTQAIAGDTEAEIEARIQKIGSITVADESTANTGTDKAADNGAIDAVALYQASCFACHGTGAAGAPKLGDNAAWAPRIAKGEAVLLANAINGVGAMPAKGGNGSLSDDEIEAIVAHMVSNSQ